MVDKNYCMSSYLAFRYIEADDKDFFPGLHHSHIAALPEDQIHMVKTADEIDKVIADQFSALSDAKLGICSPAAWIPQFLHPICAAVMRTLSAFWVGHTRRRN